MPEVLFQFLSMQVNHSEPVHTRSYSNYSHQGALCASQVPPDPPGNPHHILQCRFNLHLFSGSLHRLETGRVGVFRGQVARYGTGTLVLDSGELPHELGYPHRPLSNREITHDSISPPTLCTSQNSSCTAAYCLYKGLLAALVVPPPPSPTILLANLPEAQQGNTNNIMIMVRLGVRRTRSSSLSIRAGQPPPPLGRISMRGSSGESSPHHLRGSTRPRGFPDPCRTLKFICPGAR